jgi:hypothetical protein
MAKIIDIEFKKLIGYSLIYILLSLFVAQSISFANSEEVASFSIEQTDTDTNDAEEETDNELEDFKELAPFSTCDKSIITLFVKNSDSQRICLFLSLKFPPQSPPPDICS